MVVKHFGENVCFAWFNLCDIGIVCNQLVQWLVMSYNILITLRTINGTMFMLTKMTKLPSKVLLTKS
jgi:hypothetical protein